MATRVSPLLLVAAMVAMTQAQGPFPAPGRKNRPCPDCGVHEGELHLSNCASLGKDREKEVG